MFRALPLLLAVFVIACSRVPIEGVTPEGASQARGADRESEGNLAAIKALLARERQQFRAVLTPINRASGSPSQSGPAGDADSSSFSPAIAKEITTGHLLDGLFLAPHSRADAHRQWPQVQYLAPATRSTADYQTHNWPTAPPYTFYAPTGSTYPGTVRCVPDYLGGQRCHQSP
jgi:hypothetical protein